ncbi:unnamed protein product [Calicophoron daubneyi]|uniref:PLD phosphodiesterase domain-containing protein n=1 Tax=Calicophoron daubneyi TaxID=300641 RepID=A0AAV2TQ88_CALDB
MCGCDDSPLNWIFISVNVQFSSLSFFPYDRYLFWPLLNAVLLLTLLYPNDSQPLVFRPHYPGGSQLNLNEQEARILATSPGCTVLLVESMPENLTYSWGSPKHASTYFAWNLLLDEAKTRLNIASFYWSLLAEPNFNFSAVEQGQAIFKKLLDKSKAVNVTIAQSGPKTNSSELDRMAAAGAQIHWVDVEHLLGRGVLHTKLWSVDDRHGYLGSANMDWRSLTEVKELGALFVNCPELVSDLDKIHSAYCVVANGLPDTWPDNLKTGHNHSNPMQISINGIPSSVYFASSPIAFNPPGRTSDLDAIMRTIERARKFIYISVMDYSPEIVSYDTNQSLEYWPVIDDALRTASLNRDVEVRLLISRWSHSARSALNYLSSLRALHGIRGSRLRVRYFVVPSFTAEQQSIPYARVNHNKYMVTDRTAYIGTSNWSGDYFLYAGGASFVIEEQENYTCNDDILQHPDSSPKSIRIQLTDIFLRDWNSEYSFEL